MGRKAEDGAIPHRYHLKETHSSEYSERTEKNILAADATLIIVREEPLTGGTALTLELAHTHSRPVLVVCEKENLKEAASQTVQFLKRYSVKTLNVAGPRESEAPGLPKFVADLLQNSL